MALFSKKSTEAKKAPSASRDVGQADAPKVKKTKAAQKPVAAEVKAGAAESAATTIKADFAHVLRHARITEKASLLQSKGVYVFNVDDRATKNEVKKSIFRLYNVKPLSVRMVGIPTKIKRNMRTGRTSVKTGGKKAYVYLRAGETINL